MTQPPQDAGSLPPNPLIGLATDGVTTSFVRVDPTTGAVTLQVPRPELTYLYQGVSAFDEKAQTWFFITATETDATYYYLDSLDPSTGGILTQTSVNYGITAIALSPTGFAAFDFTPSDMTFGFGTLSTTGVFTKLRTLTSGGSSPRVDAARGVLYFTEAVGSPDPNRLVTLDVASGATLRDVQIDKGIWDFELDASGRILGFVLTSGQNEVVSIDADTGVTQHVMDVPASINEFSPRASAIDLGAGMLYQIVGGLTPSTDGLLAVDYVRHHAAIIPLQLRFQAFTVCSACRSK